MAPGDFVSVSEAAEQLSLNPSRVRAMLVHGQLSGEKVGGRWLVLDESLRARQRLPNARGRQLNPHNAWAALALASGQPAFWLAPSKVRYVQNLLNARGLIGLISRLRQRAQVLNFYGHPGVLRRLVSSDRLAATGASAAASHDLGLAAGEEVDAYVAAEALASAVDEWALEPRKVNGNVALRVIPDGLWPFSGAGVPHAAVALDLAEQVDRRSARIGNNQLGVLDMERRWADLA
ncbi:MAG: hypothetical protein ACRDLD_06000 [Thermoleophilaceae bacterium]